MAVVKFIARQRESLGSHLGLCDPVHAGHYVFDGQRFEFLSDVLPVATLTGLSELDNPRYAFPVAYWDAKASNR